VKLLYFAWVRERAGRNEETIDLPEGLETVGDLARWLRGRDEGYAAAFADLKAIRAAVDQKHASLDHPLAGVSEVAFFPPVTGG